MSGTNNHPDFLYYITENSPFNLNSSYQFDPIPAKSYLFDDGILDAPYLIETNPASGNIHYTTVRDWLAYKHYGLFDYYCVYKVDVSSFSDLEIHRSGRETDREYITEIEIPCNKRYYLGLLHNQLTRQKTDINSNIPIQNLPQYFGNIICPSTMSKANLGNTNFKAIIRKRFNGLVPD